MAAGGGKDPRSDEEQLEGARRPGIEPHHSTPLRPRRDPTLPPAHRLTAFVQFTAFGPPP